MGFERLIAGKRDKNRERNLNDYYPTHPFATYSLMLQADKDGVTVPRSVHEPAAGRGWMAYEFKTNGYDVYTTDLEEYDHPLVKLNEKVDFLQTNRTYGEALVTNPPYSENLAEKFVEHGLQVGYQYVAVLARTMFVESQRRCKFFTKNPPTQIMHFSTRFSCAEHHFFDKPLFGMVGYSWFVWDYRYGRPLFTKTSWIDAKETYRQWEHRLRPGERETLQSSVVTSLSAGGAVVGLRVLS